MAFSTHYARAISRCKWLVLLFWAGLTLLGYKYGKEGFLSNTTSDFQPPHDADAAVATREQEEARDGVGHT